MEAGELELRKVFEDVTTKNLSTIQDYTRDTRKMLRAIQEEVKQLKMLVVAKDNEITRLRGQIANIQQMLYLKGT